MKTVLFKKLPKDVMNEGITIELLDKIQRIGKMSPVMFQKGDEPVRLVKCNDLFFWVLLPDDSYLKNGNELMKFDLKTCIIARGRYWLNYSNDEIESEIKNEIDKIKKELNKTASDMIEKFITIKRYAGFVEEKNNGLNIIDIIQSNFPQEYESRKKSAIDFLERNKTLETDINNIEDLLKKDDFNSLYIILKSDGLPLLLSVKNDELEVLTKYFHKDNIGNTIEMVKNKSHLELIARFNVEKRYNS